MMRAILALTLAAALAACGDDTGEASEVGGAGAADATGSPDGGETDPDAGAADAADADASEPDAADALDATDATDATEDVDPGPIGPCGPIGRPAVYAVVQLRFAVEDEPGVSSGFDMDGTDSSPGDGTGCGKPDFESPDGSTGIDNQFARLIPTLEGIVGEDPNDSLDRVINERELVLLFEIQSLDDPLNDECVSVNVFRATEDVVFGADGYLLAGQSYDVDTERPWARAERARVVDGRLLAKGFRLELPLSFFGDVVNVVLADTWIGLPLQDEEVDGILAGMITVEDFVETVEDIDEGFASVASGLLESNADLLPSETGRCTAVSLAWTFRARRGHLYPDSPRPDGSDAIDDGASGVDAGSSDVDAGSSDGGAREPDGA